MPYCRFMQSLSPRLETVAALVTKGAYLADVGTDHAYLPVWLAQNGIIKKAVATDIAKGPLERAVKNIKENKVSHIVATNLTPGLVGIEQYNPTDVCICGMGAETIIDILDASDYVKESKCKLILQPMTKAEVLRRWLTQNGFKISAERLCYDREKLYQVIVCSYNGEKREITDFEAYCGVCDLCESKLFSNHLKSVLKQLGIMLSGLRASAQSNDTEDLEALISKLKGVLLSLDG